MLLDGCSSIIILFCYCYLQQKSVQTLTRLRRQRLDCLDSNRKPIMEIMKPREKKQVPLPRLEVGPKVLLKWNDTVVLHWHGLCPKYRVLLQQKTKKCSLSTMAEILFLFSFGVAHPDDPFSDCLAVFKRGKQTTICMAKRKKEHFEARK